jgi:hypothetical protein
VPHSGDESDKPTTLPSPELNPLVNPTLGNHMGRWAEVYFTNPPEKRDEAVVELLRELEADNPSSEADRAPLPSFQRQVAAPNSAYRPDADGQLHGLVCTCGYVNRPQYRFCGRCGARLNDPAETARTPVERVSGRTSGDDSSSKNRAPFSSLEDSAEFPPRRSDREFQFGANSPFWNAEPESNWHSSRRYVGVVLVLAIVALAYYAWRGAQTRSGTSYVAQVPPVATNAPVSPIPAPPSADANAPANSATQPPADAGLKAVRATSSAPSTKENPPSNASEKEGEASGKNEDSGTASSGSVGGSEELATARNYLEGTGGRERNTAQAAQWLWKAVGKRNADAALLLSGLYLRGDGIPKNCEQARVLLDAAATRGKREAGEMLRNLRAFGCD